MARIASEMRARMPARVGLMAEVAEAVAGAGANIEAMIAWEMDGTGTIAFVTSDNAAAMAAAKAMGATVGERDVVVVDLDDSPGTLAGAARRIADAGVNVEYAYGSTCGCGTAAIYIKCDDAAAAVAALG